VGKASDKTRRITIGLPATVYAGLEDWAEEEGRLVANLAAYQLEQSIRCKYPDLFPPPIQRSGN
jgi:hypothetical protein